jgi:hypothetical protein
MEDIEEDLKEFESKYGSISTWQKIIVMSLIILAGIYEIQVGI